jgi:hypothetical protein
MTCHLKDPAASLDYLIDWGAGLAGRSVVESDWAVSPAEPDGLAIADHAIDGARTRATISGGVAGHVYLATCRVVLSDGRVDERSLMLRLEER